jgi:hypothetical protein
MTNSNNKPCRKCGSTERYKPGPGRKLGTCKACHKVRTNVWRQANPEKNRALGEAWRKANLEKERARAKAWYKANPEKKRASIKVYEQNNPEKYAAHNAVYCAVRRGDLPRVSTCDCVDCGVPAVNYHHEDYNKPLKVEPLCKKCHAKRHHPSTNELTNHSHQA